jgi:hypothetical protein
MTRKIIAMIGQPACGKSTIMREFIARVSPWKEVESTQLVPSLYSEDYDLHVLGRYDKDELFPGTDRFSMAVQPQAIKFVENHPTSNIVFEGDRLGTASFLEFLSGQPYTDFVILHISVAQYTLDFRHRDRGDTQSETFKKGRETKVENLRANMNLMGYIQDWSNETPEERDAIVEWMWDFLQGG